MVVDMAFCIWILPRVLCGKSCSYGGYLTELSLSEGFGSVKMPCLAETREPEKSLVGLAITGGLRGNLAPR